MTTSPIVLRSDDARVPTLLADGWAVSARSWAAQLDLTGGEDPLLRAAVDRLDDSIQVRELRHEDVSAALELDRVTAGDYPGGAATAHRPITAVTASPTPSRRAFGAFDPDGRLVAMTYLDVDGAAAEVDFTVVAGDRRGRGVGTGLKAASLLVLAADGIASVRTGGSDDNAAILAANDVLGFVVDEHWLTLRRCLGGPAQAPEPTASAGA
jgi:predicted GNAT family acetyltransferase